MHGRVVILNRLTGLFLFDKIKSIKLPNYMDIKMMKSNRGNEVLVGICSNGHIKYGVNAVAKCNLTDTQKRIACELLSKSKWYSRDGRHEECIDIIKNGMYNESGALRAVDGSEKYFTVLANHKVVACNGHCSIFNAGLLFDSQEKAEKYAEYIKNDKYRFKFSRESFDI